MRATVTPSLGAVVSGTISQISRFEMNAGRLTRIGHIIDRLNIGHAV